MSERQPYNVMIDPTVYVPANDKLPAELQGLFDAIGGISVVRYSAKRNDLVVLLEQDKIDEVRRLPGVMGITRQLEDEL